MIDAYVVSDTVIKAWGKGIVNYIYTNAILIYNTS